MLENKLQERIDNLYKSMSFAIGSEPNWELFKSCFTSNAQLINNNLDAPIFLGVDMFSQVLQNQINKHYIPCLFTDEIGHQTVFFGKIAQRFSVFANRTEQDGEPTAKGINALQLIYVKDEWLIQSLTWHNENDTNSIPEALLSKKHRI